MLISGEVKNGTQTYIENAVITIYQVIYLLVFALKEVILKSYIAQWGCLVSFFALYVDILEVVIIFLV